MRRDDPFWPRNELAAVSNVKLDFCGKPCAAELTPKNNRLARYFLFTRSFLIRMRGLERIDGLVGLGNHWYELVMATAGAWRFDSTPPFLRFSCSHETFFDCAWRRVGYSG